MKQFEAENGGDYGSPKPTERKAPRLREAVDRGNWRLGSLTPNASAEELGLWENVLKRVESARSDGKEPVVALTEAVQAHNRAIERRERRKTPSEEDMVIGGHVLFRVTFRDKVQGGWRDGEEWQVSGRRRGDFMHVVGTHRTMKKQGVGSSKSVIGRIKDWAASLM